MTWTLPVKFSNALLPHSQLVLPLLLPHPFLSLMIVLQILNALHNYIRTDCLDMFIKIKHESSFYLIKSQRVNTYERLIEIVEKKWVGKLPTCYSFQQDDQILLANEQQLDSFKKGQDPFASLTIIPCPSKPSLAETIAKYREQIARELSREGQEKSKKAKKRRNKRNPKEAISQQQVNAKQEIEHKDIECKSCLKKIIGVKYKCRTCPDYYLCESCEDTAQHFHRFDRIQPQKQQGREQKLMKQQSKEQIKKEGEVDWEQQIQKARELSLILAIPPDTCMQLVMKFPTFSVQQLTDILYNQLQKGGSSKTI